MLSGTLQLYSPAVVTGIARALVSALPTGADASMLYDLNSSDDSSDEEEEMTRMAANFHEQESGAQEDDDDVEDEEEVFEVHDDQGSGLMSRASEIALAPQVDVEDRLAQHLQVRQRVGHDGDVTPVQQQSQRQRWSAEDDRGLRELVELHGDKSWVTIASALDRTRKGCRERWFDHVRPEVGSKGDWSAQEDVDIWERVLELGSKWTQVHDSPLPSPPSLPLVCCVLCAVCCVLCADLADLADCCCAALCFPLSQISKVCMHGGSSGLHVKNRFHQIIRRPRHPAGRDWQPHENEARNRFLGSAFHAQGSVPWPRTRRGGRSGERKRKHTPASAAGCSGVLTASDSLTAAAPGLHEEEGLLPQSQSRKLFASPWVVVASPEAVVERVEQAVMRADEEGVYAAVVAEAVEADEEQGGDGASKKRLCERGAPWTEEEHKRFLQGLETYGKGDWRSISRQSVLTRTPAQVASHAQKYFFRQDNAQDETKCKNRRVSIHDISSLDATMPPRNQRKRRRQERTLKRAAEDVHAAVVAEAVEADEGDVHAAVVAEAVEADEEVVVAEAVEVAVSSLGFEDGSLACDAARDSQDACQCALRDACGSARASARTSAHLSQAAAFAPSFAPPFAPPFSPSFALPFAPPFAPSFAPSFALPSALPSAPSSAPPVAQPAALPQAAEGAASVRASVRAPILASPVCFTSDAHKMETLRVLASMNVDKTQRYRRWDATPSARAAWRPPVTLG